MNEHIRTLAQRLDAGGEVTLSPEESALVAGALRELGAAEYRATLQARVLESYGHDEAQVAKLLDTALGASVESFRTAPAMDRETLEAHRVARDLLATRLERARSGADWIGAALDLARVLLV